MPSAAPCRPLNPLLRRRIEQSGLRKASIAVAAEYPHYITFYVTIREEKVQATPLTVKRLQLVADVVGFPRDEIFLDEVTQ